MRLLVTRAAFVAVSLAALAAAHGDDEMDMDMGMSMDMHSSTAAPTPTSTTTALVSPGPMSYFSYGKHSSAILAHIALMVLGWCFVLPAGKRISKRTHTQQLLTSHSGHA